MLSGGMPGPSSTTWNTTFCSRSCAQLNRSLLGRDDCVADKVANDLGNARRIGADDWAVMHRRLEVDVAPLRERAESLFCLARAAPLGADAHFLDVE